MWSIQKPSRAALRDFLTQQTGGAYTYDAVGRCADFHPPGFNRDVRREQIGVGDRDFQAAKAVFRRWEQFPKPWTEIFPGDAPIRPGETLVMLAWANGLWWTSACRIVYVVDEPDRFGFAYGTLAQHVECGEEQFLIERDANGAISYDVRSFSRPRYWAVRLAYPLTRRLQRRFVRESIATMRDVVARHRLPATERAQP
jgi:uncharacterized protein (UPF0548 family)